MSCSKCDICITILIICYQHITSLPLAQNVQRSRQTADAVFATHEIGLWMGYSHLCAPMQRWWWYRHLSLPLSVASTWWRHASMATWWRDWESPIMPSMTNRGIRCSSRAFNIHMAAVFCRVSSVTRPSTVGVTVDASLDTFLCVVKSTLPNPHTD